MVDEAPERVQELVQDYIVLLNQRAEQLSSLRRFYAYQADDLQDLEWRIQELDPTERSLVDAIVSVYTEWLEGMTPAQRHELFGFNRKQVGEWRSHLIEEVLEPRFT